MVAEIIMHFLYLKYIGDIIHVHRKSLTLHRCSEELNSCCIDLDSGRVDLTSDLGFDIIYHKAARRIGLYNYT